MSEAVHALGMACMDKNCDFKPIRFKRRPVGDSDVLFDVKYCGVCHSDQGFATGANSFLLGSPAFPCVPGHELAGVCTAVGSKVTKIKVGDHVGVGCMVDSCLRCPSCTRGNEQYCVGMPTMTYGSKNKHGRAAFPEGEQTKGGYCSKMVVHEHFAVLIPKTYPLEKAGPIMCAGITMYEPMKSNKATVGTRVGIVGLGGLGGTGVKFAKALGCHVTCISRGMAKRQIAMDAGADSYIATSEKDQMESGVASLDLILNTIPTNHDSSIYVPLLKKTGKQVLLGVHASMAAAAVVDSLLLGQAPVSYAFIGGIANTQEVIDMADKHGILPETKVVPVTALNKIFELQASGNDAGLRYVLDIAGSLTEEKFNDITCGSAPKLGHTEHGLDITSILKELPKQGSTALASMAGKGTMGPMLLSSFGRGLAVATDGLAKVQAGYESATRQPADKKEG